MSGPIATARALAAAAIEQVTDLPVVASVPERLEPPCVVITEGTPLVEPSDTLMAGVVVRLTANVIEAPTDAPLALERLDTHTDQIIDGLWAEWMPTVETYTTVTSADQQRYLASTITLTTTI
ncbi:MAG: hypothetical protein KIA99_10805 [Actinomyces urogenitalis]|uniref:hypothetical protein n=1 Tax=Actinomyces urogenitalis TaxID=103621 RepID=UPI00242A4260|nr:hypothetical protein [Actinomyces urogenitalis]MBS5978052.1 hypothetical protein [Actinomyces urogenitalis]